MTALDGLNKTFLKTMNKTDQKNIRLMIASHKLKNDLLYGVKYNQTFFRRFSKKKNQTIPKEEIQPALRALKKVAFEKAGKETLEPYKQILKHSEFKSDYKRLRKRS